jgi:hypothetical protein
MPNYRLYSTNENGRIAAPPTIIESRDDKDAIEKAREFVDVRPVEVWDKDRLLIKIEPKK